MSTFLCGSPSNDEHVVEVLRCALVRGEQEARVRVQLCLGEVVRGWFGRHPNREALCRLDSEEKRRNDTPITSDPIQDQMGRHLRKVTAP